jgi:hypothetical protein
VSSIARRLPWLLLVPVVSLVDLGVAAEGVSRAAGELALRRASDADTIPRIVVLGFDGVDPRVVAEYLKAAELPAVRALIERGGLHDLQSEIPPESPVAWASMQTGVKPSRHSIFDFIGRDPERSGYRPTNGMVDFDPPPFLFGAVPTRPPRVESRLAYRTFSERVSEAGYGVLGLRPPLAFPVRPQPDARVLSGLGTPDLAGTNGAYAFYDRGFTLRPEYTVFNGHQIHLDGGPNALAFDTYLEGPFDRRHRDEHGGFPRLSLPLRFERILPDGPVSVVLAGEHVAVRAGEQSPWMRVGFRSKTIPAITFRGLVRFRVQSVEPLQVLTDPVQIDPNDPALPISTPPGFAAELVNEGGLYSTMGWLEPTFPLNDGLMAPETFMKHVLELMDRDHALLLGELMRPARRSTRPAPLVFHVFTETDRTSHCFWWLRDTEHPAYDKQIAARLAGRDPILEIYRQMDRVIADTVARLGPDDTLLVVSDHGFQSFRYGFSVNQWLLNEGYLVLKEDAGAVGGGTLSAFFGESLSTDAVDWSKTRAYALGLGQIYVNRRGREPQGIVAPGDVAALVAEIREKIVAFVDKKHDNAKPILKAYDLATEYGAGPAMARAAEIQLGFGKYYRVAWQTALLRDIRLRGTDPIDDNTYPWSGDHCSTDRDLVPGFLLSNRALPDAPTGAPYNVRDIAATVLAHFHLDASDLDATPLPLGGR